MVNSRRRLRLPAFQDKVNKISEYVDGHNNDLSEETQKAGRHARVLDRTRNALTRDLVKYLFPIQPCVRREVPGLATNTIFFCFLLVKNQ